MKIVYKNWEPDQGLEEVQEKIYTTVAGLPARAEEIRERNIQRGNEATRYALTEDGKPLAYVTSYMYNNDATKAGIGYPWSMPDCPPEAQEKIFNELMAYLKDKDGIKEIETGVVSASKIKDEMVEFFERNGFAERERAFFYTADFDVVETAKLELTGKAESLTSRPATEDDVDTLVELCLDDDRLKNAFPDEEAFKAYFKDRVMKDGHAVLVFDGDKAIAASAPLQFKPDGAVLTADSDRIIMRFTAVRNGYRYAWQRLLVELAKECESAGWKDIPIRVRTAFTATEPTISGLAQLRPDLEEYQVGLTYKKE